MPESTKLQTAERLFIMLVVLVLGGTIGALGAWPFNSFAQQAVVARMIINDVFESRPMVLTEIRYPGIGLVKFEKEKVSPGLTLAEGLMPGGHQVRLLDVNGDEIHRWTTSFSKIWPDAKEVFPADRIPPSDNKYNLQGMWPLPDGSIVINVTEYGSARIDACSNVIWRTDGVTHHSVTQTEDGKFWMPSHRPISMTPAKYLPGGMEPDDLRPLKLPTDPYYHNTARLFDDHGRTIKEFSIVKAVYGAGLEDAIYASHVERPNDLTHMNDIEIVTPELAAKIANVRTGDLLVSLRNFNMIAILDQDDGTLKWHNQGPWLRQHDLDITPDGKIEIFNNRSLLVSNSVDTSQIVSFDPANGEVKVLFPVGEKDKFFSEIMGSHQRLPNGNRLIAETMAGRVFEVSPDGEIVWDYRLPYDDEVASLITYAMRVPLNYFEKDSLKCPS